MFTRNTNYSKYYLILWKQSNQNLLNLMKLNDCELPIIINEDATFIAQDISLFNIDAGKKPAILDMEEANKKMVIDYSYFKIPYCTIY